MNPSKSHRVPPLSVPVLRPSTSSTCWLLATAIAASAFVLTGSNVRAASDTWTGAADATWANASNWAGGNVPGTGDTATFNGAGNTNTIIYLGTGVTLGTLVFDTSSAASYTIGLGGPGFDTLTLDTLAGGIQMNSTVASDELIDANLALSTTGTYTVGLTNNSTTNTLTVAGGISASTTGAKVLTVTGAGNTTISGNITNGTGTLALTKSGAGTLSLTGANTLSGNLVANGGLVNVTAGTTNFGGGFSNLGATANSTATVNVSSGATFGWTGANGGNFASASGASGVLYNAGAYNQSATTTNNAGIYLGNAANSYGYLENSGTATIAGRLWVAQAGNAAGATGVLDITGGSVSVNPTGNFTASQRLQINGDGNTHATSTSYAGVNVVSGTLTVGGSAAQTNINTGQNEYTSFNIVGAGKFTAGNAGTNSGLGLGVTNAASNVATLSLSNGGTMETAYIYSTNTSGTNVLNIDNGTIRALSSNAQGLIQSNIKTYVYSGGATFDTNGVNTTVPNALLAPTSSGVSNITLGGTLTGYVGAPVVKISGGGGVGAAAVANFDPATGTITGITITSHGSGYTSAPTITLVGGNGGSTGAGAGSATATATLGAVTSGGITKTGAGTLTLQGANTYTGVTAINAGTLALSASASLASTTVNVTAGATLDVSANTGFTLGASQTLTGSGTVAGAMAINGAVAPGTAGTAGTLSTGNFTLASTAALNFDLQSGDVTIGNNVNDLISVGGNLTLGGTLNITELGGSLAAGNTYRLFDYTGTLTDNTVDISSAFLALHPGSTIDTSISGEVNLLVVPEPTTWAMLVGGFGMLAFGRRLRRRS